MTSDTRFVLHVGVPKTGSTTLQRALFSQHSDIYYLGKKVNKENELRRDCVSREIYDFLRPIIFEPNLPLDVEKNKTLLRERIISEAGSDKIIVASWESLATWPVRQHAKMLERAYSVFGPFRVMITIRNPLTWITSEYLQHVEGHFVRSNRPWMGNSACIDLDTWLKKKLLKEKSLGAIFSYGENIRLAIDLLGRQNLGVFDLENLSNNPVHYYREIHDFLGVDVSEGLKLVNKAHFNKSLTRGQLSHLQRIDQGSMWSKFIFRRRTQQYRGSVLDMSTDDNRPVDIALPSYWETRISDATRSDNQWIARNYELPLREYGYPM